MPRPLVLFFGWGAGLFSFQKNIEEYEEEQMPSTSEKSVSVMPFAVEVDHPRNNDLIVQCIPGCRLRSVIKASRSIIDHKTGEARIPVDQSRGLATIPELPGMQLHINPAKCSYTIIDPMRDDEELCETLRKRMSESSPFRVGGRINGVAPQNGKLDKHRMKSLCREVLHMLNNDFVRIIKGVEPKLEDIEELPGNFLLNPGSRIPNQQPVFERDYPKWIEQLTRAGG